MARKRCATQGQKIRSGPYKPSLKRSGTKTQQRWYYPIWQSDRWPPGEVSGISAFTERDTGGEVGMGVGRGSGGVSAPRKHAHARSRLAPSGARRSHHEGSATSIEST